MPLSVSATLIARFGDEMDFWIARQEKQKINEVFLDLGQRFGCIPGGIACPLISLYLCWLNTKAFTFGTDCSTGLNMPDVRGITMT